MIGVKWQREATSINENPGKSRSIVPGEVLKNSHSLFSFHAETLQKTVEVLSEAPAK